MENKTKMKHGIYLNYIFTWLEQKKAHAVFYCVAYLHLVKLDLDLSYQY